MHNFPAGPHQAYIHSGIHLGEWLVPFGTHSMMVSKIHVRLPQSFVFLRTYSGLRFLLTFLTLCSLAAILTLGASSDNSNCHGDWVDQVCDVPPFIFQN